MTTQMIASGRLGQGPKEINTQSGKPMTVASMAVELGEDETLWLGIVAFDQLAEILARHNATDCLSVTGRLQINRYTDRNGEEQEHLQVIADTLVSAHSPRPGTGEKHFPPTRDETPEESPQSSETERVNNGFAQHG